MAFAAWPNIAFSDPEPQRSRDGACATDKAEGDIQKSCDLSRLSTIQSNNSTVFYGVPLTSAFTAFLFLRWIDTGIVVTWAILATLIPFLCAFGVRRLNAKDKTAQQISVRLFAAGILMAVSTLAWCAMAIVFWVPGDIINNMLTILLLSAAMPYLAGLSSASLRTYAIHSAPLILTMVTRPLIEGGSLNLGISALLAVYSIMMIGLAVQLNRVMTSMLTAKENNGRLLVQVARSKAESDIARLRAERANQAKSTFLANMSHELRTPLNAILGFSEVLKSEMLGPIGTPMYKDYAGDIHSSGRHLLGLINDILDLSRIEAGRFELTPVDLDVAELVAESFKFIEMHAAKGQVKIAQSIPDRLPLLRADERAVRQVLLNLMTNAVKFTRPGGTITVTAGTRQGSSGLHCLCIVVRDTGIGIKEEDIPVVLEAFGQAQIDNFALTTSTEQGTGLGLPIVRRLIEAHGGTFELNSTVGVGTTATAVFPPTCVVDFQYEDKGEPNLAFG